jgi:uncharacterized protein DUF4276
MTLYIAPIVEGQTEDKCIERLLQRIWRELLVAPHRLQVLQPSREKRDKLVHSAGADLESKVQEAFLKLQYRLRRDSDGRGLLLLLLDAEHDCPADLGPRLLQTARSARSDADSACVLAKQMLENWIVGGASTLAGVNGLPNPLPARNQFEDGNGAAWLKAQLRTLNKRRTYKKTVDAKVFVQAIDLAECRVNCPSFDKLCRDLEARVTLPPGDAASSADQSPPASELPADPAS